MNSMSLSDVWPRGDRPRTVEDLKRQPDDGNFYELVDGVLEVTPAPVSIHHRMAFRLACLLGLQCPPGLEALETVGVNLAEDHHRIPDVAVVHRYVRNAPRLRRASCISHVSITRSGLGGLGTVC